ncbi:MAG: DNA sulfur modification protein DndD [Gemmataceae bacterium]|nr:DNA sulfur modification protein DndD [Gemmataceae bacterium]
MILEKLGLRNFCLFQGEQAFDLTPGRHNGRHLPIVLFGGINGGGKTTLLDAIQLALYGNRARCSKRTNLAYDDFLRQSIHHGIDGVEGASVSLSFRHAVDGQEHLFDVRRSWKITDGKVREELRVYKDGWPDAWLSDNWPQLVEELFPLDIAQLFFFDAEKIRTLAEDESSSKALGAAIKSLLGLDIVERLITDSAVLQTRLAKTLGTAEQRAQVGTLEQRKVELEKRVLDLTTRRTSLENYRQRAVTDEEAAGEAFAASGGKHWQAREDRIKQLTEVKGRETALRNQLLALAAGELPLALVQDFLACVEEQDRRECQATEAEIIQRLLIERDEQLLEVLRSSRGSATLVRRVAEHLEADRQRRQPATGIERRLDLSESSRTLLRHLREQKLTALRDEARRLDATLSQTIHEREDLERASADTPDDADIKVFSDRLKAATQNLALLTQQADQLDADLAAEGSQLKECEEKLRQVWQGQMEKEFAHEDARRMMQLAGRTGETMRVFLERVTARKIDRLSSFITESFRFLLRKQSLVERIWIDPATFAITLYDSSGHAIAKQRLSEGEKQIFAISVLWGLARASARPLPAVIDTPMARLDATHRHHLVERYFPNASHQVVIFSTDTEVDRHYYQALQPAIARAYHLNYDERARRTVGEEGYFWKD